MQRTAMAALAIGAAVLGLAAGAGAAWVATSTATNTDGHGPGPWRTSSGTGAAGASMFTRATVAHTGLWALPPSEVIYFIAERDDVGRPLETRCSYALTGAGDLPARWWSVGAYVGYHWADNPANRYSYTRSNIARDQRGGYTITVSRTKQPGNWLPLGTRDGQLTFLARLYQPGASVAADPLHVPLPSVRRLACA